MLKLLLGKPRVKIEKLPTSQQYQTVTIRTGLFNTVTRTQLTPRAQNLLRIINNNL